MVKVYISSTYADLVEEREHALAWLVKAGFQPFHSYSADSRTVNDSCVSDVAQCDVYLVIVGGRYGGVPEDGNPDRLSITHLEYEQAQRCGKPIFALLRVPADVGTQDSEDHRRALAFREMVAKHHRPALFSTPAQLVAELGAAFLRHQTASFGQVAPEFPFEALAAQISAFCEAQLTDDGVPLPFVGRTTAIKKLDDWLDDCSSPPKALLIGPAGSGKSTLLVRWLASLASPLRGQPSNAWSCVFVPISQRFDTHNVVDWQRLLCARLATVLNCPPSAGLAQSGPGAMYGEMERLCKLAVQQGKRILIVIDGIDESVGGPFKADWMPPARHDNVRLIVSARLDSDGGARMWREQLEWQYPQAAWAMELGNLSQLEVASLLEVQFPQAANEAVNLLSARVMHLTGGDPLVTRYVLPELTERVGADGYADQQELDVWTTGLSGYFRRWMGRLIHVEYPDAPGASRLETLHHILAVLAGAYGALPEPALETLVERASKGRHAVTTTALQLLSRWVLAPHADNSPGCPRHYVLAHPRLGEFLRSALRVEARAARTAFGAWATEAVETCTKPSAAPEVVRYLVQYAGAHLEATQPWLLWRLVAADWKRVSLGCTGSLALYLLDVERCFAIAKAASDWPRVIGCQIARLSVKERSALPSRLLGALVRGGVLTVEQAYEWLPAEPASMREASPQAVLAHANLAWAIPNGKRALLVERLMGHCQTVRGEEHDLSLAFWSHWCMALVDLATSLNEKDPQRRTLESLAAELVWKSSGRTEVLDRLCFMTPRVLPATRQRMLAEIQHQGWKDTWDYVACMLDFMPWAEAEEYARSVHVDSAEAAMALLPWLDDIEWGESKKRLIDSLRGVAEASGSIRGYGEAEMLARLAALHSPRPQHNLAELAFKITRRIDWFADQLHALGHILRHAIGTFGDEVLGFALETIRASHAHDGLTRISLLAKTGAFISRDVTYLIELGDNLPRAAAMQNAGYVADRLTPLLCQRVWVQATLGRVGDEGRQWQCRALFGDVQSPEEQRTTVDGLLQQHRFMMREWRSLRHIPDAVYEPLAEALLISSSWVRDSGMRFEGPFESLLRRASPLFACRLLRSAMEANIEDPDYWWWPVETAARHTTEFQLPKEELDLQLRNAFKIRGESTNILEHRLSSLGSIRRETRDNDPDGRDWLPSFAEEFESRAKFLEHLESHAPDLLILPSPIRREIYEAIVVAFDAFP